MKDKQTFSWSAQRKCRKIKFSSVKCLSCSSVTALPMGFLLFRITTTMLAKCIEQRRMKWWAHEAVEWRFPREPPIVM